MADAEIAEAAVEQVEEEEVEAGGDEAAAEDEDGCPAAKKAKTEPQQPVKLGPKTFTTGQQLILYFANLLRGVTKNRDLNEVSALAACTPLNYYVRARLC
eukprot:9502971-Pyramimonas_sp.AAC.1